MASDAVLTDKKKVRGMKDVLDKLAPTKRDRVGRKVEDLDLPGWFTKIEHSINEKKEGYEDELRDQMEAIFEAPSTELQCNTSVQKRIMELTKEIWAQVVTTTCPHCKHKSPAVKRDGFTKLFVKPLAARNAMVGKQARALEKKERSRSRDSTRSHAVTEDGKFETNTNASTQGGRKSSAHTEPEELSDIDEAEANNEDATVVAGVDSESSEEEYKEGGSQKYISPIEVQDHIRKLWAKESELLGLMYGRFDRSQPFRTNTMGFK